MSARRNVLITGCSEGGLGDALACALHQKGQRVFATARNPSKMAHFEALGIETIPLDVLDSKSIASCMATLAEKTGGSLDMLINNSGGGYSIPVTEADADASKQLFELNVWSMLAVTQAFLPLLMKSSIGATIVNNTSIASVVPTPMQGIYNASKAAAAMLTDNMRLELAPFGIKVVDLKTGAVKSRFFDNQEGGAGPTLSKDSLYNVAKDKIEYALSGKQMESSMIESDAWARQVVAKLLATSPPPQIWKGGNAFLVWFATKYLPFGFLDTNLRKLGGLDAVERNLRATAGEK